MWAEKGRMALGIFLALCAIVALSVLAWSAWMGLGEQGKEADDPNKEG
jgi:hypothetical protein